MIILIANYQKLEEIEFAFVCLIGMRMRKRRERSGLICKSIHSLFFQI